MALVSSIKAHQPVNQTKKAEKRQTAPEPTGELLLVHSGDHPDVLHHSVVC